MLPVMVLAIAAAQPARAQTSADRQQEAEMAFDQYLTAKTDDQRVAIIDYLQHLDRKVVAGALVDHILASQNGTEATAYNKLVEALNPDGCAAVIDRLATSTGPSAKGKLIVALRRCQAPEAVHALAASLDDKRPFLFATRGAHPKRVCDMAYNELFLKLRADHRYHLDASRRMTGFITEKMPDKARDALIAKLRKELAALPFPAPSPEPSPTPDKSTP
jgi:hypothetical protein